MVAPVIAGVVESLGAAQRAAARRSTGQSPLTLCAPGTGTHDETPRQ